MFDYSDLGIRRRSLRDALDALYALLQDPNDTAQGFRLLEALDPRIHHRELERMQSEPSGQKLLREQPLLLDALRDRAALEALPEGSLGRAYCEFCKREGIEPEGFVKVGEAGSQEIGDPLVRYAAFRHRDSHDLWHVVCGFRSDLAGEAGILGFTFAQTRSPALLLLLLGGMLHSLVMDKAHAKTMRRLAWLGWRAGSRARPLGAVPWEAWFARPLAEVRAELGVSDPPSYEPAYASRGQDATSKLRIPAAVERWILAGRTRSASSSSSHGMQST